jgi:hypothetical protein
MGHGAFVRVEEKEKQPQGLKPDIYSALIGTTKVVP